MAVVDPTHAHDDHHDHGEFIAHHFEGPEQQFDSGKLGIWLFLITEVLFFSGLFVAYTLYRNHHPEIFEQAHVYLNKYLGGMNTIVLLFSSLTMALAVRAAQLGRNKHCSIYVLITMVCATMFLGVKAVEYSHKWDMGILVRSAFDFTYEHPEQTLVPGLSDYLVYLCVIPAILLIGCIAAMFVLKTSENPNKSKFMGGMSLTVFGYFIGVALGVVFMAAGIGESSKHAGSGATPQPIALYAMTQEKDSQSDHDHESGGKEHHEGDHESVDHKGGDHEGDHEDTEHAHEEGGMGHDGHDDHGHAEHKDPPKFDRDIGIFFSIYYCMTGLHAIHIIAGVIALGWLYWRSLENHWRSDYFGPVDYVGLYWHLVDLIWIYLFPLLYLID
ncbi:MAG: cytochrome c oxidase subunit 3 [Planctomycetota bacterium]